MITNSKIAQNKGSNYAMQTAVVTSLVLFLIVVTFLATVTHSLAQVYVFFRSMGFINLSIFFGTVFLMALVVGSKAGKDILIKHKNHLWIGFKSAIVVLFTATVITSIIAYFSVNGFQFPSQDHLIAYLGRPLVWLLALGLFPALVAGFWYGNKLKTKG